MISCFFEILINNNNIYPTSSCINELIATNNWFLMLALKFTLYNYASLLIFLNLLILTLISLFQSGLLKTKPITDAFIGYPFMLVLLLFPVIVFAYSFGWVAIFISIFYFVCLAFTMNFIEYVTSRQIKKISKAFSLFYLSTFLLVFFSFNGFIAYQIFFI